MADPAASPAPELSVGDPVRRLIGRAVLGSLALAALFVLATLPVHAVPTMWAYGPWTQDPYHVVVSFAVIFVPLVAALSVSRAPLCRRDAPLPTRRARDLLRVSRILVLLVLVMVASAWISVALPVQRFSWTGSTVTAFCDLAVLSVASLWTGNLLWRAFRVPIGQAAGADWLADVITLGERVSNRFDVLRPHAPSVLRWVHHRIINGLRRHPLLTAAILSVVLGIAVAISQGVQERYSFGGYLLFFLVTALGVFAFITIAGQHLGLVVGDTAEPATATNAELRNCLIHAAVAASASAPFAIAFRSVIWSAFGISEQQAGWLDLNELVLGVAAVTASVIIMLEFLLHRSRPEHAT
jgi:hypothetical protein